MPLLKAILAHPDHRFWSDRLSWGVDALLRAERLLHHGQITDNYLLALAVHERGCLVSFDARIRADAVSGGTDAFVLIDPDR